MQNDGKTEYANSGNTADGEETLYGKVCPVCAKKIIPEHVMTGQKVEDLVITKFGE